MTIWTMLLVFVYIPGWAYSIFKFGQAIYDRNDVEFWYYLCIQGIWLAGIWMILHFSNP